MKHRPARTGASSRWNPEARGRARGRVPGNSARGFARRTPSRLPPLEFAVGAERRAPLVVTALTMALSGVILGAAVAATSLRAAARCGRGVSSCAPNLLAVPWLIALGFAGVHLLKDMAPRWRRQWRAFALFSAAVAYLWCCRAAM